MVWNDIKESEALESERGILVRVIMCMSVGTDGNLSGDSVKLEADKGEGGMNGDPSGEGVRVGTNIVAMYCHSGS